MNALDCGSLSALERRGWDALRASEGGAFYGDRMLSPALMIPVDGVVLDRAAVVSSLLRSPAWDRHALSAERWVYFPGRL